MGQGLRYNIQHIGDFLVDNLENAFDCVKSSTRGITLTYDIHELEREKDKVLSEIGGRVAEVRKTSPELDLFNDEKMMELFSRLGGLEDSIEAHKKEREERLDSASRPVEQYES
jgi:hypothetical protein